MHATTGEGRARLLSIVGLAGVGKSRLAWEFFKYIDGLAETIWYQRGRCLAYGEGVAFAALTEMVRMRTGILENESLETARQKLRSSVEAFIHDSEERAWVEPRLAHLLGLEERAVADPRDLYAAWRVFFERMSAQHTTLLIFEDLQWADSGLLDFIEYLLEWSRNVADPRRHAWRARSSPSGVRDGASASAASRHSSSSRFLGCDGAAARRHGAGPSEGSARAHPRPCRRRAAVCGRDGAHAHRSRAAGRGGRHLSRKGLAGRARSPGEPARAHRRTARQSHTHSSARCCRTPRSSASPSPERRSAPSRRSPNRRSNRGSRRW